MISWSRRAAAFGALFGLLSLTGIMSAAHAQALALPDGKFASKAEFLHGTWVWERQSPRQTVQMRFSRNKDFFFHNLTSGLTHYGRFETTKVGIHLVIHRTCTANGKKCSKRDPLLVVDYDVRPVKANEFYSKDEHWLRLARE
jgi:hypothetical protein